MMFVVESPFKSSMFVDCCDHDHHQRGFGLQIGGDVSDIDGDGDL